MRRSLVLFITGLLVAFVLLAVLTLSGYKVHRESTRGLLAATDDLSREHPGMRLMDAALLTLNDAENNFRMFTVLYDKKYLQTFSTQLGDVLSMVDTISVSLDGLNNTRQFDELIREKGAVSEKIGALKKSTDSMLSRSIKDDRIDKLLSSIPAYKVSQIKKEEVTMDTVSNVQQDTGKKKGVFKRLGNALANKKDTVKAQMAITVKTKSGQVIDKEEYDAQRMRNIITDVNSYYKNILKKQLSSRLQINSAEQSLAVTNIAMLEELRTLITALRNQTATALALKKQGAEGVVTASVNKMKSIAAWALVALLLSLAAIALFIYVVRNNNRRLEAARLAAEEEARVRTDFLTNMSHEIRTPLNSIVGFSEQLSYTALDTQQQRILHSIEVAGDMLMQVVNDVLDFSKLEKDYISIQQQPFVLYHAFEEVMNTMRVQAFQKKLSFNTNFEGDEQCQVSGDIFRLQQILLNLVSNAIKYTDQGNVTVTAKLKTENGKVMFNLTVSDTGEGISAAAQTHLFERFYQVSSSRTAVKGTGLGLAITQRLIKLHGGDISLTSEVNKGTTFVCHIPYTIAAAPLAAVSTQQDPQQVTGALMEGRYVLVADDQEMNLLLLKLILTRWNCRFDMAISGQSALELFDRHHYDLVLLDLHMPGMSGLDVMEKIRKNKDPEKAGVVAYALTANISQTAIEEFKRAGFNDWLMKPFREKDLYGLILKTFKKA
ncbi:ATP-binding protein [Chitinophaga sp. MM2321]|uniref:ATP-binding response regulator n=1 Tax=Chitinophaga sp. MM2321 TaxID=3137178 RepID=UPI0032D56F3A